MKGRSMNRLSMSRAKAVGGRHFAGLSPILDWSRLARADEVDVYQGAKRIASGRVDLLAPDGSLLWIQPEGVDGRRLFLRGDVMVFKRGRP